MYAIVDIAGQQFKVQKDQKIFVHRLEGEEGAEMNFDQVLLLENEGKVTLGSPAIKDAKVTATVLEHVQGDKVIVFKKKRRKGYKLKRGHRQQFTKIQIGEIIA
jgi:large subunit ribosomal protein L21